MPSATAIPSRCDAAIVGGGHNGLVAACYLARAGLSVVILERNHEFGGATRSKQVFPGVDARLSVYSYLVSLFPAKITEDLGLDFPLLPRKTASFTPYRKNGRDHGLLIRRNDPGANREALKALTGSDSDFNGFLKLQEMQEKLARAVWPGLMKPLETRDTIRDRMGKEGSAAWQDFVEEPLGRAIENHVSHDLLRGILFTDGKIGLPTHPHDPSLLQNRCFLYHIIGRGTGEWQVPAGGMGRLVDELLRVARSTGKVTLLADTCVSHIHPETKGCTVAFDHRETRHHLDARFVLCNASGQELGRLTGSSPAADNVPEGTAFKINMVLGKLPRLRVRDHAPEEAFAGTVHINEGYGQMLDSHRESTAGRLPSPPPGEIYCHTLTDGSILSDDLRRRGFHTLTLFGLDLPHSLFTENNAARRQQVVDGFLDGINAFLDEPLQDVLARDAGGAPCLEAMSAVDLENTIHLPKGNIFHGALPWPFAETEDEAGQWGVETPHPAILLCGSSAKRGGAVSGIPGHNAARKVLEELRLA
jgi:phytoene dehydrogenase-like protein